MARPGILLEAATSFYSNLAFGLLSLTRQTQEELRTDKFVLSTAAGRGLSFWLDATEGWWSSLLATASAPMPTLFVRIGPMAGAGDASGFAVVPGEAKPQFTPLTRVGGTEKIPPEYVVVEASTARDAIQVKLKNLVAARKDGKLKEGLYQSLVYLEGAPLANLLVLIEPKPAATAAEPGSAATAIPGTAIERPARRKKASAKKTR